MAVEASGSQQGWFDSNWKWLTPLGCLAIIIVVVALSAGVFTIVVGSMKSSWAYTEGLILVAADPEVAQELGEPVAAGWFVCGSLSVSGPTGNADLAIPLSGPNGSGTLYVVATKKAGKWSFELAEVEVAGRSERIDLLRGTRGQVSSNQLHLPVTSLACARVAAAA